jgi:hypothetical protein
MDCLKYYPGPPCPADPPCPTAVFYPFGHPRPYAYDPLVTSRDLESKSELMQRHESNLGDGF